MLEAVSLFIICLVTHILDCYIFSKLINEKFKVSIKAVLLVIFFSILDYIIYININDMIRMIVTNLISIYLFKIIYKKDYSKSLVSMIFIYAGYMFSEIFLALIVFGVFKVDSELFNNNLLIKLFSNIIILLINLMIFNIKNYLFFVRKVVNWCDNKRWLSLLINCLIITLSSAVLMYPISFNNYNVNILVLILIFIGSVLYFMMFYLKEKSNNNQLTVKYDNLLDYVKDYELVVVEKGKAIHEHKNQLAVIDDMIPKSNKKLKEYVSEKLDKVSKLDDNVWLEKLTNLPTGGTKGLVYLKIKKMLDNNISIYVEIDDDLKTKNKWNNVSKNLEDYTRILGVYLDNAIEASIESKDKQIIIEFIDNEDNIEFILSNTYKGKINFGEIDKEKYSTKGKGRGYGLSLVKDIVEKNKLINQSREINGKFYVQKLYIKK